MDLIRSTLDVYLGGYKGYGQTGYFYNNQYGWLSKYDSSGSTPSLVIAACYYILDAGDKDWARKNYAVIKGWADKMMRTDTNGDGIIEYGHTGNTGSWDMKPFQRPANWWDAIGFGHDDAYSNALAYRAVMQLAEVAALIGETEDQKSFSALTGGRFGTRTVLYNYDPFPAVGDTAVKGGEGCVLTDLCLDSSGRSLKKSGYIEVPADGVYCFFLPARDRGELFIDDRAIIGDGIAFRVSSK